VSNVWMKIASTSRAAYKSKIKKLLDFLLIPVKEESLNKVMIPNYSQSVLCSRMGDHDQETCDNENNLLRNVENSIVFTIKRH